MATSIQIVNMTPSEMFKLQLTSTMEGIRFNNENTDVSKSFSPTHLGGIFGQREILAGKNVMRQTKIT